MKKLIYILGICALITVITLNLIFTAELEPSEHIIIKNNNFLYIMGVIILAILILVGTEIINKKLYNDNNYEKKKKIRKNIFITVIIIFAIFNIVWCIVVRPPIVGDQIHACNLAQTFYNGNLEEFLPDLTYAGIPLRDYMQAYHQQISLAFVFSLFFRIIHFDGIGVLRVLNIIGNIFILLGLYKINCQLSKKYKTNKALLLILIATFISLTMLSTFIYGDIPSIALCLFAVYYTMKYEETNKIKYVVIASILTMFAYMMRMNSLIFIIATIIYLLLNTVKGFLQRTTKENLIKIAVVAMYIVVSIIPSSLVKNYYLNKYNMDKNKAYPNISYFLMAMEESWRGNGWYNENRGEYALKNPEKAKIEYVDEVKERLTYFSQNIGDAFNFYTEKLASMWAENTYSAVRSNRTQDIDPIDNMNAPLTFYQKAILLLTCACCLIVLIQNRKNISLELIFLVTIFIGGFSFHILWEAKSRYIIPYILVLIPIASISIDQMKIKEIMQKIVEKYKKEKTSSAKENK